MGYAHTQAVLLGHLHDDGANVRVVAVAHAREEMVRHLLVEATAEVGPELAAVRESALLYSCDSPHPRFRRLFSSSLKNRSPTTCATWNMNASSHR